jgi:hypothetical protein
MYTVITIYILGWFLLKNITIRVGGIGDERKKSSSDEGKGVRSEKISKS